MRKKALSIVMCVFMLASVFVTVTGNVGASGFGNYPPPTSGDWIIDQPTFVIGGALGETISIDGYVRVIGAGSLTMSDVTLDMTRNLLVEADGGVSFTNCDITGTSQFYGSSNNIIMQTTMTRGLFYGDSFNTIFNADFTQYDTQFYGNSQNTIIGSHFTSYPLGVRFEGNSWNMISSTDAAWNVYFSESTGTDPSMGPNIVTDFTARTTYIRDNSKVDFINSDLGVGVVVSSGDTILTMTGVTNVQDGSAAHILASGTTQNFEVNMYNTAVKLQFIGSGNSDNTISDSILYNGYFRGDSTNDIANVGFTYYTQFYENSINDITNSNFDHYYMSVEFKGNSKNTITSTDVLWYAYFKESTGMNPYSAGPNQVTDFTARATYLMDDAKVDFQDSDLGTGVVVSSGDTILAMTGITNVQDNSAGHILASGAAQSFEVNMDNTATKLQFIGSGNSDNTISDSILYNGYFRGDSINDIDNVRFTYYTQFYENSINDITDAHFDHYYMSVEFKGNSKNTITSTNVLWYAYFKESTGMNPYSAGPNQVTDFTARATYLMDDAKVDFQDSDLGTGVVVSSGDTILNMIGITNVQDGSAAHIQASGAAQSFEVNMDNTATAMSFTGDEDSVNTISHSILSRGFFRGDSTNTINSVRFTGNAQFYGNSINTISNAYFDFYYMSVDFMGNSKNYISSSEVKWYAYFSEQSGINSRDPDPNFVSGLKARATFIEDDTWTLFSDSDLGTVYYYSKGASQSEVKDIMAAPHLEDDFSAGAGAWTPDGASWSAGAGIYTVGGSAANMHSVVTDWDVEDIDYAIKAKIYFWPTEFGAGLAFRYQDQDNYYVFQSNSAGTEVLLKKQVSGTWTTLQSQSRTQISMEWAMLKVVVAGDWIYCYINDVLYIAWEDTDLDWGRPGLYADGSAFIAADFDDVEIYPVAHITATGPQNTWVEAYNVQMKLIVTAQDTSTNSIVDSQLYRGHFRDDTINTITNCRFDYETLFYGNSINTITDTYFDGYLTSVRFKGNSKNIIQDSGTYYYTYFSESTGMTAGPNQVTRFTARYTYIMDDAKVNFYDSDLGKVFVESLGDTTLTMTDVTNILGGPVAHIQASGATQSFEVYLDNTPVNMHIVGDDNSHNIISDSILYRGFFRGDSINDIDNVEFTYETWFYGDSQNTIDDTYFGGYLTSVRFQDNAYSEVTSSNMYYRAYFQDDAETLLTSTNPGYAYFYDRTLTTITNSAITKHISLMGSPTVDFDGSSIDRYIYVVRPCDAPDTNAVIKGDVSFGAGARIVYWNYCGKVTREFPMEVTSGGSALNTVYVELKDGDDVIWKGQPLSGSLDGVIEFDSENYMDMYDVYVNGELVDSIGFLSDTPLTYDVSAPVGNKPPVAWLVPAEGAIEDYDLSGEEITLDALGSVDMDAGDTLTYAWSTNCGVITPQMDTSKADFHSDTPCIATVTVDVSDGNGGVDRDISRITVGPDLTLTPCSIRITSVFAENELRVTIEADVYNVGGQEAQDVVVRFYDGDPNQGGSALTPDVTIPSIPEGEFRTATFNMDPLTQQPGTIDIFVEIDPLNAIEEADEFNNLGSNDINVVLPNLVVTDADVELSQDTVAEGDSVTITAEIYNYYQDVADVDIGFYNGATLLGTVTESFQKNTHKTVSYTWPSTWGEHGILDIVVRADDADDITEGATNELDNEAHATLHVIRAIYVDDNYDNGDAGDDDNGDLTDEWHQKTIPLAIAIAEPGDIIEIYGGTYSGNVFVNKPLIIRAIEGEYVVVDGSGGFGFRIFANDVELYGMTITNCAFGIYISGFAGTVIEYNIIEVNDIGIYANLAEAEGIWHNDISNNRIGVKMIDSWLFYCMNWNTFIGNTEAAIDYDPVLPLPPLEIDGNIFLDNGIAIRIVDYSDVIITNNLIERNDVGIYLDCSSPRIEGNIIRLNRVGMYLTDASVPTITGNDIYLNSEFGIVNEDTSVIVDVTDNWWGGLAPTQGSTAPADISFYVEFASYETEPASPQPPIADAGSDIEAFAGDEVTLDATGSHDPDGTIIVSYTWDFGDGTTYTETAENSPDGIFDGRTTHVYEVDVTTEFLVILTVEDDAGMTDSDDSIVTVKVATIEKLQEIVDEMDLHKGMENGLIAKLNAAQASLERGREKTALNQLGAFINEVEAQTDKKITQEQADWLIEIAREIIGRIEEGEYSP